MTETEICEFICKAEKCNLQDIKDNWTFITEWNTEHMQQYRLYLNENGDRKVIVVEL